MTLTPLRRAAAATAALSLSFALVACGGDTAAEPDDTSSSAGDLPADESDESDDGAEDDGTEDDGDVLAGNVLSEDELEQALLTPADLPGGYVEDPDEDDEDSETFVGSCLEDIGNLTDRPEFDADEEVEAAYLLAGDAGQSGIQSQVESYSDEQQIVDAIAIFSEAVGACTEASGTDPDGTSYDLTLQSDQTVSLSGVDEQARVAVTGTITTGDLELPVDIGFNVARIGNNLITISTLDIGEVGDGIVSQTDTTAQISVDRLAEITG